MTSKADLTLHDVLPPLVADLYSLVPAVSAVLHSVGGVGYNAWRFWIFTSNERYDDELMTELIDVETGIMDAFPAASIDIRYVPLALISEYSDATGYGVTLLWERS